MTTFCLRVACPNCGHPAERRYLEQQQQVRTQCPSCDYLMKISARTGAVIEAYAPGLPACSC